MKYSACIDLVFCHYQLLLGGNRGLRTRTTTLEKYKNKYQYDTINESDSDNYCESL